MTRTHFDEDGDGNARVRHERDADGQALDLVLRLAREAFHAARERLEVVGVRDLEDELRVALR